MSGECVVKINDIIREDLNTSTGTPNPGTKKPGLWNRIKQGAKGAVAGVQNARAQRELTQGSTAQVTKELSGRELQKWQTFLNQYVTGTGGKLTPQVLQSAAKQFTAKRYASAGPDSLNKVTAIRDVKSANNFIAQTFNLALANQKTGAVSAPIPAATDEPAVTATTPATTKPETSPGWVDTPEGIQIRPAVGNRPTVARYNKQLYVLTNDDRWLDVRDRPVSATLTALLNNALEQT